MKVGTPSAQGTGSWKECRISAGPDSFPKPPVTSICDGPALQG